MEILFEQDNEEKSVASLILDALVKVDNMLIKAVGQGQISLNNDVQRMTPLFSLVSLFNCVKDSLHRCKVVSFIHPMHPEGLCKINILDLLRLVMVAACRTIQLFRAISHLEKRHFDVLFWGRFALNTF